MTAPATRTAAFDSLLDDAAIFPPGDALMSDALRGYARSLASADARCIGSFLCSGARIGELLAALPDDVGQLDLSLVLRSGSELGTRLGEVAAADRLVLRAVELPAGEAGPAPVLEALAAALPTGVLAYVELPLGPGLPAAARAVADAGHRVKLRTGGTAATAFPDQQSLGEALTTCVRIGVPVKLTAGLHSAARHRDRDTGFEHHGFLDVLLAVAAALDGADVDDVVRVLAERDAAALAERVRVLTDEQVAAVRSRFVSFGTCSTAEPLADLHALELLP
ncbi:MAG: hypothetical protein LH469_11820 [Frankiaceae bacterium]|nr:hypothetical protein [Frankiaceae bacterium]